MSPVDTAVTLPPRLRRPSHRRMPWILLVALVAGPALAIEERQFALAFPIAAPPSEPVFAFELPAEAYATLDTDGLLDLAVVDAAGQAQSIGLLHPPPPLTAPPLAVPLPLPIAVPRPAPQATGRLELHVQRSGIGQLETLDLRSVDPGASAGSSMEWLLDADTASRPGYDAIRVRPTEDAGDFRLVLDLLGSDDLVTWTTIGVDLPLLRASDGGRRIERLELAFPRAAFRYLLLRPQGEGRPLPPLASVEALRSGAPEGPPSRSVLLSPSSRSEDGLRFEFSAPGPLPIRSIDVQVGDANVVREYELSVEHADRWVTLANGVAWQLDLAGTPLRSDPLALAPGHGGRLRLMFTRADPAPRLALAYVPDRVVVVASGTPPYRLLVGSATYRGSPSPVGSLLEAVKDQRGASWQPPLAELGPARTVSGAAALEAPLDPGRFGLWGILGLGALAVGGMAWRLLRNAPPSPPPT